MDNPVHIGVKVETVRRVVEALTDALEALQEEYPEGPDRAQFILASHMTIGAMWQFALSQYPYELERENVVAASMAVRARFWPQNPKQEEQS